MDEVFASYPEPGVNSKVEVVILNLWHIQKLRVAILNLERIRNDE